MKIDEDSHAARRGAGGRAGPHHHHDAAEVPVRASARSARSPARNYAVVIDEAHSSQTGEAAKDLRLALGAGEEQELTAAEAEDAGLLVDGDRSRRGGACAIRRRAQRPAVEPLVLRLHRDAQGPDAGDVRAPQSADRAARAVPPLLDAPGHRGGLHHGRARQLHDLPDLLEDREGDRGRPRVRRQEGAARDRALREPPPAPPRPEGRDHRRALPRSTRAKEMGGLAKAMVVTSSRLHAVRYKQNIDKYITGQGLRGHQDPRRLLRQDRRRHRASR